MSEMDEGAKPVSVEMSLCDQPAASRSLIRDAQVSIAGHITEHRDFCQRRSVTVFRSNSGMTIGDRVKQGREAIGLKVEDLAAQAGLAASTLYELERGDNKSTKKLHRIAAVFGVATECLESGKGWAKALEAIRAGKRPLDSEAADPYEYAAKVSGLLVSAGPGRIAWEHEVIEGSHAFRRSWMQQRGLKVDNFRMVTVSGDSMTPYLQSGDVVMVDLADTNIKSGEVYVIAVDREWKVKRLHKRADGSVEVRSDNESPRNPTEIISGERLELLKVLGRVVWRGG